MFLWFKFRRTVHLIKQKTSSVTIEANFCTERNQNMLMFSLTHSGMCQLIIGKTNLTALLGIEWIMSEGGFNWSQTSGSQMSMLWSSFYWGSQLLVKVMYLQNYVKILISSGTNLTFRQLLRAYNFKTLVRGVTF